MRMCSTSKAYHQYKWGCAARVRHIISTNKDVQYKWGTSSVQMRMCNMSKAYHQCKWGCAVQARHIISTNEDVQYKQGISSVQLMVYRVSQKCIHCMIKRNSQNKARILTKWYFSVYQRAILDFDILRSAKTRKHSCESKSVSRTQKISERFSAFKTQVLCLQRMLRGSANKEAFGKNSINTCFEYFSIVSPFTSPSNIF